MGLLNSISAGHGNSAPTCVDISVKKLEEYLDHYQYIFEREIVKLHCCFGGYMMTLWITGCLAFYRIL